MNIKARLPQAALADAIIERVDICHDNAVLLDELMPDCDLQRRITVSSCCIAEEAYEQSGHFSKEDVNALALFPIFSLLLKNKCNFSYLDISQISSCCTSALFKNSPTWSKRFPLIGFQQLRKADEIFAGLGDYNAPNGGNIVLCPNSEFVQLFTDKLQKIYGDASPENDDYYLLESLRRYTLDSLFWIMTTGEGDTSEHATYKALHAIQSCLNGDTETCNAYACSYLTFKPASIIVTEKFILDKTGLKLLMDFVSELQLDDLIPSYAALMVKIDKLA